MTGHDADLQQLRSEAERAFGRLVEVLAASAPTARTLVELVREFARLRSALGNANAASKLGLNEDSLARLAECAHEAARRASSGATGGESQADFELSLLRLLAWLETAGAHLDGVSPQLQLMTDLDEEATARRVRAVELIARSLITESYRTQEALLQRLRALYRPEFVDRWLKMALRNDALSGMTFSDLATLLVSKQEFGRYEPLFSVGNHLRLFQERRRTLREYLDGLRFVRNGLAHHKPVTALQRRLVERYYEEITAPVLGAYQAGSTTVDPGAFLDSSREDLQRYLQGLREDLQAVSLDVEELKVSVALTVQKVSVLEGAVVLLIASGCGLIVTIVVSMFEVRALGAPPMDFERLMEMSDRSMRGVGISAATFMLAGARIVLNALVRQGKASGLAARLKGKVWRALAVGWTGLALLVYAPSSTLIYRAVSSAMLGAGTMDAMTSQIAALSLDVTGLRRALDRGVDPNSVSNGQSLLSCAMNGSLMGPNYQPLPRPQTEARRLEMLELLLGRGAKPTKDDVDSAKIMGKLEAAVLLEAALRKQH